MVQPLQNRVWWILKKLSLELSYDPLISLLGRHSKELKIGTQTDLVHGHW